MKNLVTVIYYTSNREDERFENRIKAHLLKAIGDKDLPIISVSHKPIGLGKNICIGEQYPCDVNIWRQKLIACKAAKTPFVICAEADFLYPPEYFEYTPKEINEHHRYLNVWILNKNKDYFYRKESSEGAEIVGRERYIQDIEKALKKKPDRWATESDIKDPAFRKIVVLWKRSWIPWKGKIPAISVKTGDGIRTQATPMTRYVKVKGSSKLSKLPYWGTIEKVKEIFND